MSSEISSIVKAYIPQSFLDDAGNVRTEGLKQAAKISHLVEQKLATLPEAEKEHFLSLIQAGVIDLTPDGVFDSADINDALDRLSVVAGMLADLSESFGDITTLLAKILIDQAASERKSALIERLNARENAKNQLIEQANSMRESANTMRSGAHAAFVMSIAMSVASGVLAGISLVKTVGSTAKLKEIRNELKTYEAQMKAYKADKLAGVKQGLEEPVKPDFQAELQHRHNKDGIAQQIGGFGQTAGQIGMNASNYASTLSQADAKTIDAAGQILAALAQDFDMFGDLAKDIFGGFDELIRTIISFIKDLAESEAELARSFTRV